ncbi:chlorophyll A-B binding protein [Aureococcus anophagefferens]|nr:chlorophyll A-B binding protein [Aureococcus anophagefferens]
MARFAALLALAGTAGAYVAPVAPKVSASALKASPLDGLEGGQMPLGNWDPLNLADTTQFGPTLEWYRAAELKHCRVAMAAFVGMVLQANGWIIAWVGLMELCTEIQKPHYLMGGKVGEVNFDPVAKTYSLWDPVGSMKKWDDATKARGRLVELQNGRAAMFGVAGLVSAWKTDGSVPSSTSSRTTRRRAAPRTGTSGI